jgi:lactoylglutathione lyase
VKVHSVTTGGPGTASNSDLPVPRQGVSVTQLLIVRDLARSQQFYESIFDAKLLMKGPPAISKFYNTWLILSTEGDATDDRPGIAARAPGNDGTLTSPLNLRVADIKETYELWRSRGAEFLTPPKEHDSEIRCYLKDTDGHLIEVGQTKQNRKK